MKTFGSTFDYYKSGLESEIMRRADQLEYRGKVIINLITELVEDTMTLRQEIKDINRMIENEFNRRAKIYDSVNL